MGTFIPPVPLTNHRVIMGRLLSTILFLTLTLSACGTSIASPQPLPPSATEAPLTLPTTAVPFPIETLPTPHIDQPPDGNVTAPPPEPEQCGYQWAYGDLPELSSRFQQSIRALEPEAEAKAFAFGENCVRADGSIAKFAPMETDFNVTLHVDDLANEAVLGRWIVQVMEVIENIPPEQISGPRPGRVSIVFQSSTAQSVSNFYINQYQALPAGLSHEEVYHSLQTPP